MARLGVSSRHHQGSALNGGGVAADFPHVARLGQHALRRGDDRLPRRGDAGEALVIANEEVHAQLALEGAQLPADGGL